MRWSDWWRFSSELVSGFNYFSWKNEINAYIMLVNPCSFYMISTSPPLPLLTLELELGVYHDKSCFTKIKSVSRRPDREFNSGFLRILTWQIEIKQSHLNTQQIIASQGLLTWGFNVVTWAYIIYIIFRKWSGRLFSVSVSVIHFVFQPRVNLEQQ